MDIRKEACEILEKLHSGVLVDLTPKGSDYALQKVKTSGKPVEAKEIKRIADLALHEASSCHFSDEVRFKAMDTRKEAYEILKNLYSKPR